MSTEQEISRLRERLSQLEELADLKRRIQQLESEKCYPVIFPNCSNNCCGCTCNCWKARPYNPYSPWTTTPYITWSGTVTASTSTPTFSKNTTSVRF